MARAGLRRLCRILSRRRPGRLRFSRGRGAAGTISRRTSSARRGRWRASPTGSNRSGGDATQDFVLGAGPVPADAARHRDVDTPIAELEAIGRADLERNSRRFGRSLRPLCAGRDGSRLHGADEREEARGRPGRRARGGSWRGCRRFLVEQIWSASPARAGAGRGGAALRPAEFRLHQHSRTLRAGLPSVYYIAPPDPSVDARGASRRLTFPARPTCCSPRCTRSGRATSSASSTPTARPSCSARCSSATPSPKAGPTTARR